MGVAAEKVEQIGDDVVVTLSNGETLTAQYVLAAPGRKPFSEGLGYPEAGVDMDRAAVKVDEFYRTNLPNIYAIGDLIGGMMLAHGAEAEGEAAAKNAVAELSGEAPTCSIDLRLVPAAVYTEPGIGVVGSTRDGAKERGLDAIQVVLKFGGNGKALAEGHADGFVQIVGPHAAELIQEVSIPMAAQMTVAELGHAVFGHPTVSEVIMFAAREAADKTGTAH